MWVARLVTLLLPLGVWLVISAATPRTQESRIVVSGLIALILSNLLFAVVGFGLLLGGVGTVSALPELNTFITSFSLPVGGQAWGLFGLHGFMLDDVNTAVLLDVFVNYASLVAVCAMLTASLLAPRSGYGPQVVAISLVSGLIFPIVGFWMWGGGWLGLLGTNLNLGHGAVDVGGLATTALVAAGAGIGWNVLAPRQTSRMDADLPPTHFPFRAFVGAVCVIIGAAAQMAGNPLHGNSMEKFASALLLSLLIPSGVAALVALSYSTFVSHHPNPLAAARAVIAAVIAVSAGGILLPMWSTILLGVSCGLIVTVGLYVTNEVWGWQDDVGVVSMTLLPAVLGFLATGLLANGGIGAGWNGVGAGNYLGMDGLGIVGMLPLNGQPSDPGQLSAQLVAVIAGGAFAYVAFLPFALALRRMRIALPQPAAIQQPTTLRTAETSTPIQTVASQTHEAASCLNVESLSAETVVTVTPPVNANNGHAPLTNPAQPVNQPASKKMAAAEAISTPSASQPADTAEVTPSPQASPSSPLPKESLLQWLRRGRAPRQAPEKPAQPRHVAYPIRVGGRRIPIRITPLRDDSGSPASPTAAPAADSGEAAS